MSTRFTTMSDSIVGQAIAQMSRSSSRDRAATREGRGLAAAVMPTRSTTPRHASTGPGERTQVSDEGSRRPRPAGRVPCTPGCSHCSSEAVHPRARRRRRWPGWSSSACAESSGHPPELGTCEFDDASCRASVVVGGDAGTARTAGRARAACPINAGDSQCTQCAESELLPVVRRVHGEHGLPESARAASRAAPAPLACASDCEGQSPNGVALLDELTSCHRGEVPRLQPARESAIPAVARALPAIPGSSCSGLVVHEGLRALHGLRRARAPGAETHSGFPNACVATAERRRSSAGPAAQTDSDCALFPGSFCFATTSSDGRLRADLRAAARRRSRLTPGEAGIVDARLASFRKF